VHDVNPLVIVAIVAAAVLVWYVIDRTGDRRRPK